MCFNFSHQYHTADWCCVHLAVLVTLCLACQYSHLDQPLLKMYTKLPLE